MFKHFWRHKWAIIFFLLMSVNGSGQPTANVFKLFGHDEPDILKLAKPMRFYEILCSRTGEHKFSGNYGLMRDKGMEMEVILYTGPDDRTKKLVRNYIGEDSIRSMYESTGKLVFFISHDNKILWQPGDDGGSGFTPFDFPPRDKPALQVSKIWIDAENNLYIGTRQGELYFIQHGAIIPPSEGGLDSSGNYIITKGKVAVNRLAYFPGAAIYSFEQDLLDKNIIWIGTGNGLMAFNKATGKGNNVLENSKYNDKLTVTDIKADSNGNIWFSTLKHGMGLYAKDSSSLNFFDAQKQYSIQKFCRKSATDFFVAVADSVPAIFNTVTGNYSFIQDSIFRNSADSTTDIKLDGFGNLLVVKGGSLYYTDYFKDSKRFADIPVEDKAYAPFITEITLNGLPYREDGNPRNLKSIHLKYYQNSLTINYSLAEFANRKKVQFAWKTEGYLDEWVEIPVSGDALIPALLTGLAPGKYIFKVKAKVGNEDWRPQMAVLEIIIEPPFWRTWWFWLALIAGVSLLVFFIVRWRVQAVRKQERLKAKHERELLELEARALRAQMNPHFIFNCLNSIKALIQQQEEDKAITYLTTFSKLIRTIFNNSDKREISLFDEIETCKLYAQLESMRFENKFSYSFAIDEKIDLKSVSVPALIIQPFIENAIWHGIMPKEDGGYVHVSVKNAPGDGQNKTVCCIIDDNGIGREMSKQNKFKTGAITHHSKGMQLTQNRIDLDNLLNKRNALIEIIDKKDENEKAAGTRVIITFMEY